MAVRIYTKGGDKGKTSLHGGERVDKDDIRIEAIGTIDELNSYIGVVRSAFNIDDSRHELLFTIQRELMVVMSLVATPAAIRCQNPNVFNADLIVVCERQIDSLVNEMPENDYFILPGGTVISAHLHYLRTITRRAERRLITLHKHDPVPVEILQFINRLSDLFFTMGRFEMLTQGAEEERWHKFLYKKKKTNK